MGVMYFLVCVRKHESSLPTNISTTVGKKTEWYIVKCDLLSKTTFLPYFMTVCWVFFYQSMVFLPMVFIMVFITIVLVCFYDFCKTVLVKKYPPCRGMIWFFLSNVISFTLAFMWLFNYTIKALLSLRKTWKNGLKALPSNSHWGLRAPDPSNPNSEKMTSQPTFFCCTYFPKSVIKLHRLFNTSNINTHFDMFLKN